MRFFVNAQKFLSCLFGSEPGVLWRAIERIFLSCLFGSELTYPENSPFLQFLSCLFGSERRR